MTNDGGLFGRIAARVEDNSDNQRRFSPADLLDLDDHESVVIQVLLRQGEMSLDSLAAIVDLPNARVNEVLDKLASKGALVWSEKAVTISNWRSTRTSPGGIWARLGDL